MRSNMSAETTAAETTAAETTAAPPLGLRERKKQQTRAHIAETARRLFTERGFEAVTVAEVARAADVAEKTVFNYFPTKEDLFYSGMEAFEERLLGVVRGRAPGESVLDAFRGFFLQPSGEFALEGAGSAREATQRILNVTKVIVESPALRARERQVLERYGDTLAGLIAEETGADPDDVEPFVVAHALLALHRSLIEYVRRRVLAGASAPQIAEGLRAQAETALARLEGGLGDYDVRR
jgi:AcrR family transcriptional regulator